MSIQRYNYWCPNPTGKCTQRINFIITKPEEEKDNKEYCLECESELKLMGIVPYGGVGKFQSMTPQQKQQVLQKRSKEHFKKHIKDKQIEINRKL